MFLQRKLTFLATLLGRMPKFADVDEPSASTTPEMKTPSHHKLEGEVMRARACS